MRSIAIRLINAHGDELGQLPLTSVALAEAGTTATEGAPSRRAQIAGLMDAIDRILQIHGLTALQSRDFIELSVCLALLQGGDADSGLVAVSVATDTPEDNINTPIDDIDALDSGNDTANVQSVISWDLGVWEDTHEGVQDE